MQSSVRQNHPRVVDTPEPLEIGVNRAVSVTSTRPNHLWRKASDWTLYAASENHYRVSSRPDMRHAVSFGGEEPSIDDTMRRLTRGNTHRPETQKEAAARLEQERQSLRELAAFLKTKEPPPNNYMSIPDSDEPVRSKKSRSDMFRFFQRHDNKKVNPPRHLRLPDSAVAAKTINGNWHIAISIPIQHDHPENAKVPQISKKPSRHDTPLSAYDGPVVVLPPIIDNSPVKSAVSSETGARSVTTLPKSQVVSDQSTVLGMEAATTLKNYYRQESLRERKDTRAAGPLKSGMSEAESIKSAFSVQKIHHHLAGLSSLRYAGSHAGTDPRHSGGTAYSERSLESVFGHTRDKSSVSTAPSVSRCMLPQGIDAPSRMSSRTVYIDEQSAGLVVDPSKLSLRASQDQSDAARLSFNSQKSFESDASSAKMKTADLARSYSPSELALSIRNAPRTPAPNRALPDLPEGYNVGRSASCRTLPARNKPHLSSSNAATLPNKSKANDTKKNEVILRTRQERVRAIRLRDIASLRTQVGYKLVEGSAANTKAARVQEKGTSTISGAAKKVAPSSHQTKRRSTSTTPSQRDSVRRSTASDLSPIMVVADFEPNEFRDFHFSNDFIFPTPSIGARKSRNLKTQSISVDRSHTPPRSITPSLASSDEDGERFVHSPRPRNTSVIAKQSTSNKRRAEENGNIQVQEQDEDQARSSKAAEDLEVRLRRIERSNEIILQTLDAVVKMGASVRELNQLLLSPDMMEKRMERASPPAGEKSLDSIEPLMMELRMGARISGEIERADDEGESLVV